MKKYFSLILFGAIAVACTKDDPASIDAPETAAITTSTSIIYDAVDPNTQTPDENFDNSTKGMYHGIVVSQNAAVHGKIWINIANDGDYNATVITDESEILSFFGTPNSDDKLISFSGERGSFVYDVTDYTQPTASEVFFDGIAGYVQTVKDLSNQRASAMLGTYVDDNDDSFTGTWDIISGAPLGNLTINAAGDQILLSVISQVCILGPGGAMFVDDVFEDFGYECIFGVDPPFLPPTIYMAPSDADPAATTSLNEIWAQEQSVTLAGFELFYYLGQSTLIHQTNPQFTNPGFHVFPDDDDDDPDTPDVRTCFVYENGQQGLWAWNGRSGRATFVDIFAPTPPTLAPNGSSDEPSDAVQATFTPIFTGI